MSIAVLIMVVFLVHGFCAETTRPDGGKDASGMQQTMARYNNTTGE